MDTKYTTKEGEILAIILFQHYGKVTSEILKTVLSVNYGLARQQLVLPMDYEILLPYIADLDSEVEVETLW